MFKVNNKDTSVSMIDFERSSVSMVDFEQANVCWVT